MPPTIEELTKKAGELTAFGHELEAKLAEITQGRAVPKIDGETFERKIRFETNGGASNHDRVFGPKAQRDPSFEELSLLRSILAKRGSVLPDSYEKRFQEQARQYTMTTEGAATGAELVPVEHWRQLWEDVTLEAQVASLFYPALPMTSKTMELSEMGDAIFYKPAGEGQAVTAVDLATAKRTITACPLKAQVDVSDELNDDAVVALIPAIRATLVRNAAEAIDEAILNADTTGSTGNINDYGATIATDSRFLIGFDGLVHYALAEVTGQKTDLGALDVDDFLTLMGKLDKYVDTPQRCAFIVDRWVYLKMLGISNFLTVDKLGAKATLLTGQVGSIFDIVVIKSAEIAKSDANGRIDGATPGNNTKGRIVLVNRDMWKLGMRKIVTVATERSEAKGMTSIVATFRIGLQCFGDRSASKYCHTALGYDITI